MKRYPTDHKHLEDHAWECRFSLQGKKDSGKDFEQVRKHHCYVWLRKSPPGWQCGGQAGERARPGARKQLGSCGSGPGKRQGNPGQQWRGGARSQSHLGDRISMTPGATEFGKKWKWRSHTQPKGLMLPSQAIQLASLALLILSWLWVFINHVPEPPNHTLEQISTTF